MDNINGVNHIHPLPAVEAGVKAGQRIAVDLSGPQDTVEFTTEKKRKGVQMQQKIKKMNKQHKGTFIDLFAGIGRF